MKGDELKNIKRLIISRTDSIGDSVLTLPLCGFIKENYPHIELIYMGKEYVRDVVMRSHHIDIFMTYDPKASDRHLRSQLERSKAEAIFHVYPDKRIASAAFKCGIQYRIGTSHRLYHLTRCNRLVNFTRRNSDLHEAQLNFRLLRGLGLDMIPNINDLKIWYGVETVEKLKSNIVVLHPGSRGSAADWPVEHYITLGRELYNKGYKVQISGTEEEGQAFRKYFDFNDRFEDITGHFSLGEFCEHLKTCRAIVASSTGPLHIGAMLGIEAIGLYVDIQPVHPGRWAPVGKNVIICVPPQSEELNDIEHIRPEKISKYFPGLY